MKAVNVDEVLKLLYRYGEFIFVTDYPKYREMQDKIANLPQVTDNADEVLDKIRAEIEKLPNSNPSYWHCGDIVDRDDVLEIIDDYRESE